MSQWLELEALFVTAEASVCRKMLWANTREAEIDLSLVGVSVLHPIYANKDEKFVVQFPLFTLCLMEEDFKASFLPPEMKVQEAFGHSL